MALQIWLPLTKDLRQQGLLNTPTFSLNAFTQEANGKLGQYCYTDRGIIHFTEDFLANQWSLACWVKSTSWSANNDIILCKNASESTNSQFYLSIINGTSFNLGINGGSNNGAGGYSYTFSTNTWYHVAATYNGTNYAMYINGNQVKSGTCTTTKPTGLLNLGIGCRSTNAGGTASTGNANKRLNDVRIYDHCLSPMEVKELAKGLVLHYPLNRQNWGQENLLSRYVVPGQAAPTSTAAGGRTTWLGDYKITIPATENADTYFRLFTTKQLTANATYTISCKVDGLLNGSYYRFPLYAQSNTAMGVLNLDHNGLCSLTFTMTYGTQTAATGANGETVYICFMDDSSRAIASGQGAITISNFKLEEGSIATPWCSNLDLFDQVTYDKTIYIESDGSRWIRIAHHNNPSNSLFTSSDTFAVGVYKDVDRWYQIEHACNFFPKFEFMVKQKTTSDASEVKYRWIQSKNPNQATWTDVQPSMVTRITTSGYTNGSYGGIYKANSSTRMVIANASNGNWFGAFGSWTAYNGGIPGYPNTTITTGYMDLYIRIDDINISGFTTYDCSGYGNNGSWYFYDNNGSYKYISDTPKYSVSTYINSINNTTNTASGSVYLYGNCALIAPQYLTVAFWCKPVAGYGNSTGQGQFSLTNYNIGASAGQDYDTSPMNHRDSVIDMCTSSGTHKTVSIAFTANEWHHYAIVYDGRYGRIYKDGVATGATLDMGSVLPLKDMKGAVIGFSKAGGVWRSNKSYYSDFRIYATALSADDIKSLYQNKAYIDSLGTIHGKIH